MVTITIWMSLLFLFYYNILIQQYNTGDKVTKLSTPTKHFMCQCCIHFWKYIYWLLWKENSHIPFLFDWGEDEYKGNKLTRALTLSLFFQMHLESMLSHALSAFKFISNNNFHFSIYGIALKTISLNLRTIYKILHLFLENVIKLNCRQFYSILKMF